jgi:Rad3-related DNA helicase
MVIGDAMNKTIEISVRKLVEYVLRSGSIDNTFRGNDAMAEGIRAHQIVQGSRGDNYQKEVTLSCEYEKDDILFQISGRCDGLERTDSVALIEEIKSTVTPLSEIEEDQSQVHWAQAKMYAYMYSLDENLPRIEVKLTYYHIHKETEKSFIKTFDRSELDAFMDQIIDGYIAFAKLQLDLKKDLITSAYQLDFPFTNYRKGQREMAIGVYRGLQNGQRLFINAPTGIGKTMSTIFPAVKAIGEELIERFFYLTAKTITRTVAEESLKMLMDKGLDMRVVTLTAKDKICFMEATNCNKDYCPYANGYYDRLNPCIIDLLKHEHLMTREVIEVYAERHKVCPFELSLDISFFTEAIICDYNYVFDPRVSLKRMGNIVEKRALLVDEAHNLVDRSREMFSATLSKSNTLDVRRCFPKGSALYKKLSKINTVFLDLKKSSDGFQEGEESELESADNLYYPVMNFMEAAEKWLKKEHQSDHHTRVLDYYFECMSYTRIYRIYDDHYTTLLVKDGKSMGVKLYCLDPSELIKDITRSNHFTVFFSATLLPHDYFRQLFGRLESDRSLILESPFDHSQQQVHISSISTRYKDRSRTLPLIRDEIQSFISAHPGNYLVFFPSYKYMNQVYEMMDTHTENVEFDCQWIGMSESEREDFLDAFDGEARCKRVAFATLGGIFSEGVDLRGERLTGVIIISVGLPQLCFERQLIGDYFSKQGLSGYDYAYVFPGMNKILQAGGRLIRSELDQGNILLIDDRYLSNKYLRMFPKSWQNFNRLPPRQGV